MISKYEITAAEREAAKELAHIACIDKIATMEVSAKNAWDEWCELSEQNASHIDTIGILQAEIGVLELLSDRQKKAIERMELEHDSKSETITMQERNIQQFVTDNAELSEEIKTLVKRVASLNGENNRLIEDLEASNQRYEELSASANKLAQTIQSTVTN